MVEKPRLSLDKVSKHVKKHKKKIIKQKCALFCDFHEELVNEGKEETEHVMGDR